MKEGKVWGESITIISNEFTSMHHVFAKKGGVCSTHSHKHKTNLFLVIKGKLLVRVWKNDLIDDVILSTGEYTEVPQNQDHLFEALEDTEFIELYYPTKIDKNDIVRKTQGFKRKILPNTDFEHPEEDIPF